MNMEWREFCAGAVVGAFFTAIAFTGLAHTRDTAVIKLYQEGKIECATVGGEFICREVQK